MNKMATIPEMTDGNITYIIDETGYCGAIQLNKEFNPDIESIYTTADGGYDSFDTPDKCAEIIDHEWRDIIDTEARVMLT